MLDAGVHISASPSTRRERSGLPTLLLPRHRQTSWLRVGRTARAPTTSWAIQARVNGRVEEGASGAHRWHLLRAALAARVAGIARHAIRRTLEQGGTVERTITLDGGVYGNEADHEKHTWTRVELPVRYMCHVALYLDEK